MVRVALLLSLFATALCADGKIAPSPVPGSGRVKHSGPDFSFEIPGGYTPLPATAVSDPEGFEVLYCFTRIVDGKSRGVLAILSLGSEMEQIVLTPQAFPSEIWRWHPSIFRERWKTLDLYCLRLVAEEHGVTQVRLMAFVPVKGCAIRVELFSAVNFEPSLITALRDTLKSLEAETNWVDTAPGQPNEPKPEVYVPPPEPDFYGVAEPRKPAAVAANAPAEAGKRADEPSVPIWLAALLGSIGLLAAVGVTLAIARKPRNEPLALRRKLRPPQRKVESPPVPPSETPPPEEPPAP